MTAQQRASDPAVSVWVAASAGTGKTKVLTDRVLRLLLADTQPERVLCLTFTKAAANVMAVRLAESLGKWTHLDAAELSNELAELTGAASGSAPAARKPSSTRSVASFAACTFGWSNGWTPRMAPATAVANSQRKNSAAMS